MTPLRIVEREKQIEWPLTKSGNVSTLEINSGFFFGFFTISAIRTFLVENLDMNFSNMKITMQFTGCSNHNSLN